MTRSVVSLETDWCKEELDDDDDMIVCGMLDMFSERLS